MKTRIFLGLVFLVSGIGFARFSSAVTCTHYASPTGTGNGGSISSPFKVASFWLVAKPGTMLCLLDGVYTGSLSMIIPPKNLTGTATAPITVRALNDGKVTIHGQGTYTPVRLFYNHYFILEGLNARNSATSVVSVTNSNNNVIRRVAAWDARDSNYNVFTITSSSRNLLEDVAGWGLGRKIFSSSQGGNYTTIRRAWGRWEGSHVVGPKMTYSLTYNNYNTTCENCIGTWSGERMKQTYTLMDYDGSPWTGSGRGTYTNYSVNQPYGIFTADRLDGDKNARSKLLGSIAYARRTDRFHPPQSVYVIRVDSFTVADSVAYLEPGYHTSKYRFSLNNLITSTGLNLIAKSLTGIGGKGSIYGTNWKKSSLSEGTILGSVANVFTSTGGAKLCYRYKDGLLTTVPLWPWPMNQRIINAMLDSGRSAVDVTATVQLMLGTIPSNCKGTTINLVSSLSSAQTSKETATTLPSAPADLQVRP